MAIVNVFFMRPRLHAKFITLRRKTNTNTRCNMEHTDTKELVTEALNVLKDKIAAAYDTGAEESVTEDVENISTMLTDLIEKLEEFAFNSARSSEGDEQYTFTDFEDFKNTMNGR